jgi:hypothetical protein
MVEIKTVASTEVMGAPWAAGDAQPTASGRPPHAADQIPKSHTTQPQAQRRATPSHVHPPLHRASIQAPQPVRQRRSDTQLHSQRLACDAKGEVEGTTHQSRPPHYSSPYPSNHLAQRRRRRRQQQPHGKRHASHARSFPFGRKCPHPSKRNAHMGINRGWVLLVAAALASVAVGVDPHPSDTQVCDTSHNVERRRDAFRRAHRAHRRPCRVGALGCSRRPCACV